MATLSADSMSFNDYLSKKKHLDALIERHLRVLAELQMDAWYRDVSKLRERVRSDAFKVLVMGEFNRGKSTFINALLGQRVLPAYVIPTTAIINEVKWDQTKHAVLHYLPEKNGKIKQPLDIPIDQIGKHTIIQTSKMSAYGEGILYKSPYEKVELFWPLDLCRDGVEIIDSPGLNEDMQRQMITLEYLKTVDAVLFVVACDFALSRSELQVLDIVREAGHEHLFLVFNRINLIRSDERDLIINRCLSIAAPFTKGIEKNVFFIDALGALEGRLEQHMEQVRQSHIEAVEQRLKTFLAMERGRMKLLWPTTELKSSIHEAQRTLLQREKLLHIDLKTLQERYAKAQTVLMLLQEMQDNIDQIMANAIRDTQQQVFNAAYTFFSNVANQIPDWAANYTLKDPITLLKIFSTQARERIVEEVISYLSSQIEQEFAEWQAETLEPLLSHQLSALASQLEQKTQRFAEGMAQVRLDLVAGILATASVDVAHQDEFPITERILAVASGFLIDDIGGTAQRAAFGLNEMLTGIIPQLTIVTALGVLIGLNPFFLIPAILLGAGLQAILKTDAINQKIRNAVGKEYTSKLQEARTRLASSLSGSVEQKLKEIQTAISNALGLELQNLRDQVDSIINMKEQEQSKVEQVINALNATQHELHAIDSETDEFIKQVILMITEAN